MSGEQETIQAATEALGRPHELSELRLLGLLEADRTPGEIEVARAITELGSWLCPDAEVSVRLAAARSYLDQRTGRKELRAAGESTWSIAGVVPQATPGEITIEIRELPLVGEGKLLNHGTADEHRGFAFAMAGERPPVVEVQVKVGQEDVRRIGPVRTQPATWVTASEPGIAESGRVSTPKSRSGRFEVQQRWLHAVANGVAGVNDEVLAAYSGASIHDVRRQRWANELAPHLGNNRALAWVLLMRCCLASEFDPEQWLEEAKESLAVRAPAHIAAEIERAFGERFLAEANRADVPKVLEAHRALRREIWCARRHPDHPEGSTWREILDAAGLEPDRLAELPSLFEAGLDDVFDRLQAPGTNLSEAVRARLAWVPLVRYDHTAIARVGEDAPPIAVTRHPPEILAARLTDVAEQQAHIVRALEDRFPGHAVLWHLKPELGEGAQPLFDAGLLDLDKLTVGMWEGAKRHDRIPAARGTTAPIPSVSAKARAELAKQQRLLRVGQTKAATLALGRAGHDSAHSIAAVSPAAFAEQMKSEGIDAPDAAALHARAAARVRATTSMYLESVAERRSFPTAPPGARRDGAAAGAADVALRAAVTRIPTLETLFGPLDSCECDDCESVTSLSAYLVDLLLWLDRAPLIKTTGDGQSENITVYEPFNDRRPDVAQIELSCTNSETLVPHIDIVCELLEDRIATLQGLAPIANRQTTGTAAEIRAYPDHLNSAVYENLSDPSKSPWPFNHFLAEIRGYLAQKGSSRPAVMAVFGDDSSNEYAAELLGLSIEQFNVLATENLALQAAIWGDFPEVNMEQLLRRGALLARGTVTYDLLVQVLRAPFLAQGRTLMIDLVPNADGQKIDLCRANQRIVKYLPPDAPADTAPSSVDASTLDRLHRILRLSSALGWDPREVCVVVEVLGATPDGIKLDADTLKRIAFARAMATDLKLSALDIALWFGPFRDDPESPLGELYRSLFTVDGVLLQDKRQDNGDRPKLADLAALIGAALGMPASMIAELVAGLELQNANADTNALARIYRHARLLEAMGLNVPDYLSRCALFSLLPFEDQDPDKNLERLRDFMDVDTLLERSGVDEARLRLLLSTDPEPDTGIASLWKALVTIRLRRADVADAAKFIDEGLWREPVGTWLGLSGADAGPAFDMIARQFKDTLTAVAVIGWAFQGDVNKDPPARTEDDEKALRILRRFVRLFELAATRPDLTGPENPHLTQFVSDGSWEALLPYLRFAALGSGSLAAARVQFAEQPSMALAPKLAAALGLDQATANVVLDKIPLRDLAVQWHIVERRLDLIRKLKLPADVVADLASTPVEARARRLREAYRASIPRDAWLATSTAVQNMLRPVRRDVLLEFLLATTGRSAQDWSDEFLIDTLTGEGRDRSRIGEACAAIQTFVNRIIMGFESSLKHREDALWNQWFWRKRYALWKGNRMVFLFPENYLSSGKRPRTSPLFKNFQDSVARGEVNEANVSAALIEYLDGLTEIADLEYLAVGSDYNSNDDLVFGGSRVFATVARTRGTPGRYYFASLESGVWTPFEELKLGEDPAHVALFSAPGGLDSPLNRHILVWPKATLFPRPNQINPSTKLPVDGSVTKAQMVLGVKYTWTERQGEADWSPVKTTSAALLFDGATLPERQMLLSISTVGDVLPGEFKIITHYYKEPGQTETRAPSLIGSMTLRRDTTDKISYNNMHTNVAVFQSGSDPAKWSGPEPADDLLQQHLSTRQVDFSSPDPGGKRPWSQLRFDQNRMRSLPGNNNRACSLVAPFWPDKTIITPPSPYSVTVLPWRDYQEISYPSAWAFFVSGTSWSFFVAQRDLFPEEISQRCKQALGFRPNYFAPDQLAHHYPFSAVPAYHPFAAALLALVKARGLRLLYDRVLQRAPGKVLPVEPRRYADDLGLNRDATMADTNAVWVPSSIEQDKPSAQESIDFSGLAPHASYNMELFVFVPLLIANNLQARGRYKEAQKFFHYIFNPLEGAVPIDEQDQPYGKSWWITPAFDNVEKHSLRELLTGDSNPYAAIESSPFDAQAVAFGRRSAYQRFIVMEYLRNILAWADSLFAQGDLENLDEAGQLYSLAASILGERPLEIPPAGKRKSRAFNKPEDWRPSGNILAPLENLIGDVAPTPPGGLHPLDLVVGAADEHDRPTRPYFQIPRNEVLRSFYRRVDDALVNLRTCKSLGISTAVDVQALVNAAAAGKASLFEALAPSGRSSFGPRFRRVLIGKALELCNDARSLGASVQAASERLDGEHLAALRSSWEGRLFDNTRATLEKRKLDAQQELAALQANRLAVIARRDYYGSRERMNIGEAVAFGLNFTGAAIAGVASLLEIAAAPATAFPNITLGAAGAWGSPVSTVTVGGSNVGSGIQAAARGIAAVGGLVDRSAAMVATQASYDRRLDDWQHQKEQADLEIAQIDVRIESARLRVQIADAEIATHDRQRAAWAEQDEFLRTKFTTEDLYLWLLERSHRLYARAFELAMDMAMRAKAAYTFELPDATEPELPRPWDASKRGGLAAEELSFALRRMDATHLELDRYDVWFTRRLSLRQLAPASLIELREASRGTMVFCSFDIPGWWIARLDPQLHERRIRSVAVSVACVTGPNASVNATFSYVGATSSPITSIQLSSGVNDRGWDGGETDRYAPFEGISLDAEKTTWRLTFPEHREVYLASIADVVITLEYTAKKGAGQVPPPPDSWQIKLDLERDAPPAWQALTRGRQHKATIDPQDFVPEILFEMSQTSTVTVQAKRADGNLIAGITGNLTGNAITLDGTNVAAEDWSQIKTIYVDWKMQKPA